MELEEAIELNCDRKITMHVSNNRFKDIKEFEDSIKKKFKNAIIGVIKTKNGYYAEIYVLKDDIPDYSKEYIKALINMFILQKQIQELGDPELNYIVKKASVSVIAMLAKATNEVIKSYKIANEVYRFLHNEKL